ncbi:MAG: hypothetical protein AB7F50_02545 [Fimbriimonadaceae bacterium]
MRLHQKLIQNHKRALLTGSLGTLLVCTVTLGEAQLCPSPEPPCTNGKSPVWVDPYCCTESVTYCRYYKAIRRTMLGGTYCYNTFTYVPPPVLSGNCGYVEGTNTPVCY